MTQPQCPGSYLSDSKVKKHGPRLAVCPECEGLVAIIDVAGDRALQKHPHGGTGKTFVDPGHP